MVQAYVFDPGDYWQARRDAQVAFLRLQAGGLLTKADEVRHDPDMCNARRREAFGLQRVASVLEAGGFIQYGRGLLTKAEQTEDRGVAATYRDRADAVEKSGLGVATRKEIQRFVDQAMDATNPIECRRLLMQAVALLPTEDGKK